MPHVWQASPVPHILQSTGSSRLDPHDWILTQSARTVSFFPPSDPGVVSMATSARGTVAEFGKLFSSRLLLSAQSPHAMCIPQH